MIRSRRAHHPAARTLSPICANTVLKPVTQLTRCSNSPNRQVISWRAERRRSTAIGAVSRALSSGNKASRWAMKSGLHHKSFRMSWRYAMTAGSVQRWRKTSRIVERPSRLSVKAARMSSSSRSRTHWGPNAVQVCAGRGPAGHRELTAGGLGSATDALPSLVMRAQSEEDFPGGFDVGGQAGSMLHGRMDIPKVPLQAILAVDGVGAGRMEHAVHYPYCLVHAVRNGQ